MEPSPRNFVLLEKKNQAERGPYVYELLSGKHSCILHTLGEILVNIGYTYQDIKD